MITGAVHAPSQDLMQSMTELRALIDARRAAAASESAGALAASDKPEGADDDMTPIDAAKILEATQEERDAARQAAVLALETNITKSAIHNYTRVMSSGDDDEPNTVDPVEVYQASLKYARRADLIEAFSKAGEQDSGRPRINVLV